MKAWSLQACDIVDRLFSTPTNLWLFGGNTQVAEGRHPSDLLTTSAICHGLYGLHSAGSFS